MSEIFADTSYWIALLLPKDKYHGAAEEYAAALPQLARLVTSELVFVELLNFISNIDPMLRRDASRLWHDMKSNSRFIS